MDDHSNYEHDDQCGKRTDSCQAELVSGCPKGDNDKGNLESFEEDSFETQRKSIPVKACTLLGMLSSCHRSLACKDCFFIMEGFVTTRPENRFTEPLQPKD